MHDPFVFVAVSLDEKWEQANRIFPKPETLPKHIVSLLDSDSTLAHQFGSFEYPETYLLDQNLQIITKWIGPQRWNHQDFYKNFIDKWISNLPTTAR